MSMESPPGPVRPYSVVGGILSYLLPGLGQIFQGRISKGVLFMVCLLSMFHAGEAMGSWQNVYVPPPPEDIPGQQTNTLFGFLDKYVFRFRHFAGQVWIGVAAWPAIWQYYEGPVPAQAAHPFLHNYQKAPEETAVNKILVNSDKTPDLGWIFTVIAGMLNILVIYDAYAGPAYGPRQGRAGGQLAGEAGS